MWSTRLPILITVLVALTVVLPVPAATLVVNSAADSGVGTLREAIGTANGAAGVDTINFAPALAGQTIHLLTDLPQVTDNGLTINGDINADGAPDVALSGDQGSVYNGLDITSANNTVRGLCINYFTNAIYIHTNTASGNKVLSCYLGTNLAGTAPAPNEGYGIYLYYARGTTIGGTDAATRNLVSGNYSYGINAQRSPATLIRNLYCGLNAAGDRRAAQPERRDLPAVLRRQHDRRGGGDCPHHRERQRGVRGPGVQLHVVQGFPHLHRHQPGGDREYPQRRHRAVPVGLQLRGGGRDPRRCRAISCPATTATGWPRTTAIAARPSGPTRSGRISLVTAALPNTSAGIYCDFCSGVIIGGTTATARNVISGNNSDGVYLSMCRTAYVRGNYVGVTTGGNADLRNDQEGVEVRDCQGVNVGGATAAERNVIVAGGYGVYLSGALSVNLNVMRQLRGVRRQWHHRSALRLGGVCIGWRPQCGRRGGEPGQPHPRPEHRPVLRQHSHRV